MQVMKEEMPLVSNVMVIGDNKKFLSMLVSLKVEVDPDTAVPTNILTKPAVAILEGCVRPVVCRPFFHSPHAQVV